MLLLGTLWGLWTRLCSFRRGSSLVLRMSLGGRLGPPAPGSVQLCCLAACPSQGSSDGGSRIWLQPPATQSMPGPSGHSSLVPCTDSGAWV